MKLVKELTICWISFEYTPSYCKTLHVEDTSAFELLPLYPRFKSIWWGPGDPREV